MRLAILGLFTACGPRISTFDHNGVDQEYVLHILSESAEQAHCYSISTAMGGRQTNRWTGLTCVSWGNQQLLSGLSTRRSDEWFHPLELWLQSDNKSTSDDLGLNALVTIWSQSDIDADRVYVGGYSNGGFMSCYRMLPQRQICCHICSLSTMTNSFEEIAPTRPVSVFSANGTMMPQFVQWRCRLQWSS